MESEQSSFLSHYLNLSPEEEARVNRALRRVGFVVLFLVVAVLLTASTGVFKEQDRMRKAQRLVELSGAFKRAVNSDGYSLAEYFGGPDVGQKWHAERGGTGDYLVTLRYVKQGKQYQHYWRVDLTERKVSATSGPIETGK